MNNHLVFMDNKLENLGIDSFDIYETDEPIALPNKDMVGDFQMQQCQDYTNFDFYFDGDLTHISREKAIEIAKYYWQMIFLRIKKGVYPCSLNSGPNGVRRATTKMSLLEI